MDKHSGNKPSALPGFLIGEQLPPEPAATATPVDVVPAPAYAAVDPPADGIGKAVPAAKATGRYSYAADRPGGPGMLYAALARSPVPHAALLNIDLKPALDLPGVHAVLAGPELGVTAVEYRGQCVAVAAAEHPALARAALDAVEIQYAPGEPLLDARQVFAAARRTGNDSRISAYRRYTLGPGGDLAEPEEGEATYTVMYGYEFGRGADPAAAPGAVLAIPLTAPDGHGGTALTGLELHTACADPVRDLRAVAEAVGLPIERVHLVPAPFTGTRSGDDPDLRVAAALPAGAAHRGSRRSVRAEGRARRPARRGRGLPRAHDPGARDAPGGRRGHAARGAGGAGGGRRRRSGGRRAAARRAVPERGRAVPLRGRGRPGLGGAHAQSARRTVARRGRDGRRGGRRSADRRGGRGGLAGAAQLDLRVKNLFRLQATTCRTAAGWPARCRCPSC